MKNWIESCEAARSNPMDIFNQPIIAQSQLREMDPAIFFLHIEKCGGSTMTEFIVHNEPKLVNLRFKKNTNNIPFRWNDKESLKEADHLEFFKVNNLHTQHTTHNTNISLSFSLSLSLLFLHHRLCLLQNRRDLSRVYLRRVSSTNRIAISPDRRAPLSM